MIDVLKSRRNARVWITGDTKPGSSDESMSKDDNNVIQYILPWSSQISDI